MTFRPPQDKEPTRAPVPDKYRDLFEKRGAGPSPPALGADGAP
jgi:hypothetical protein